MTKQPNFTKNKLKKETIKFKNFIKKLTLLNKMVCKMKKCKEIYKTSWFARRLNSNNKGTKFLS